MSLANFNESSNRIKDNSTRTLLSLFSYTRKRTYVCHLSSPSQKRAGHLFEPCPARVHPQNGTSLAGPSGRSRSKGSATELGAADATSAFIDAHGGAWWCTVGWLISAPSGCAPASVDRETSLYPHLSLPRPAREMETRARALSSSAP